MLRRGAILTLTVAALFGGSGEAARAQDDGGKGAAHRRGDRDSARREKLGGAEEEMLRGQIEDAINQAARWDAEKKRIVLNNPKDMGPMAMPAYGLIMRLSEPGADGRLHIRKDVRLRPFMKVVQDFVNDGGLEDLQKLQKMRQEGGGENPFKDGIPPRVTKAIGGLMRALNEMGQPGENGDEDGDGDKKVAGDDRPAQPETQTQSDDSSDIRKRIAERLHVDPQVLDAVLLRAEQVGEALAERARAFAASDEGQRLIRRAESEVRRIAESDQFQKQVADLQKRAGEFMQSERGQELQRKAIEYYMSPNGQRLQRRLQDFLRTERGQEIERAIQNALRGRGGAGGERPRDDMKKPAEQPDGTKDRPARDRDAARHGQARRLF